jgi:L-lactate dehydrogenase complex protein LldG
MKVRTPQLPLPQITLPLWTSDLLSGFIAKAKASAAQVHEIASLADAPHRIAEILRMSQAPLELHIPTVSPLNELPWHFASELSVSSAPPNGDQSAFSMADYGIAETGTLVFASGPKAHSSWHFRPGREFIVIEKSRILARFEDVISRIQASGVMPATVNLITGPSRTADIEQTIEMGAHGPRDVHILVA